MNSNSCQIIKKTIQLCIGKNYNVDDFNDPHLLEFYDMAHSSLNEERYITIGCFHEKVILFVVSTDNDDGDIQLITAREATTKEKEAYYDQYRKNTNSCKN